MIRSTPEDRAEAHDLCRQWGPSLELQDGEPEGAALLLALFGNEHYNAANPGPRLETAYCPGGRYFDGRQWEAHGEACAKSYSNWQIMYPVARELGYQGKPQDLDDDTTAIEYVVRYLNRRCILKSRKKTGGIAELADILDAYNSGSPLDGNVPTAYIARGKRNYQEALRVLGG